MRKQRPDIKTPVFSKVEDLTGMRIPKSHCTPEMARILERLLYEDQMTNLPTGTYATGVLQDIVRYRRQFADLNVEPAPYTLVFIDLNNFGRYNKKLGMQTTDNLVISFAKALEGLIRQEGAGREPANRRIFFDAAKKTAPHHDMLARIKQKGDEFLLLMEGIDKETAEKRIGAIQEAIANDTFLIPEKRIAVNNVSFAVGCYQLDSRLRGNETYDSAFSAIDKADQEMRKNKNTMKETTDTKPIIRTLSAEECEQLKKAAIVVPSSNHLHR